MSVNPNERKNTKISCNILIMIHLDRGGGGWAQSAPLQTVMRS